MQAAGGVLTLLLGLGPLAAPNGGARAPSIAALARGSARPRECMGQGDKGESASATIWDVAREPNLNPYCTLLARGYAELAVAPERARESAERADRVLPGHAAPLVLIGRVASNLGKFDDAARAFERARAIDSRSLEDPFAMRDWARALARTARPADALVAYRSLVPRLPLFFGGEERGAILLEAADVALSLGPPDLDDAIAFLEEAREVPLRAEKWRVLLELALAYDRRGMKDEAQSVLGSIARARPVPKVAISEQGGTEFDAASALFLETRDPAAAARAWQRYADVREAGPWGDHARAHLEALRGGRGSPTRGKPR